MKVAFVSQPWENFIPPVQGGSLAIWIYQIAKRTTDCEVVVYSRRIASHPNQERYENIECRRVAVALEDRAIKPFKLLERLFNYPSPKRPFFASTLFYLGYAFQIARDLQTQGCDIVHILNFSQFVPIIRWLNPRIKIVLHMQCDWLSQLDYNLVDNRLAATDLILGCSDHVTRLVAERFPHHAHKCHTVWNGVDVNHFLSAASQDDGPADLEKSAHGDKRLLFVGRVSPEKGVHVLLDAFAQVVQRYPQVQLDVVGHIDNAPYEFMVLLSDDPEVKKLAEFYNRSLHRGDYRADLYARVPPHLADRIHFVGQVAHSTTLEYYRKCTILINPSLTEAFGMTLAEAMASEKPVVAASVGGMVEIVQPGETGLLVAPGDPEALADAIVALLQDETACRRMGKQGRKRVANLFAWERLSAQLMSLYEEILTEGRSAQMPVVLPQ